MSDEKLKLCRLYEKQSSRGNTYFVGRLGGARIVMMRDERADVSEGTVAVWELMLSPAGETPPPSAPRTASPRVAKTDKPASSPFIEDTLPWSP